MPYKPGQSGNPNGRPKGRVNKLRAEMRKPLQESSPEIIQKAVDLALSGNDSMIKLCLDKIIPSVKSIDSPVELFELTSQSSITEKANAILSATGAGQLSPTHAGQLLSGLSTLCKAMELDEINQRLTAIEQILSNDNG